MLEDVSFLRRPPGGCWPLWGPPGREIHADFPAERFYDPLQGTIRIDGQDIRGVTWRPCAARFPWCCRIRFLFNGTIAQNISYGMPDASVEQIVQAAVTARRTVLSKGCRMATTRWWGNRACAFPAGRSRGLPLRGGAAADPPSGCWTRPPPAVDTETECEIQAAIEQLSGTRTIIVIAHRLSTVMRADQILVLHHGRIAEQGTHQGELLEKNGVYARLCHVQQLQEQTLQFLGGSL